MLFAGGFPVARGRPWPHGLRAFPGPAQAGRASEELGHE